MSASYRGRVVQRSNGHFESPFQASSHLLLLKPLEPAPSAFAGALAADIGTVLLDRTDVAAVIVTVDGNGNVIAPVDVWTLPNPVANPCTGGFNER